MSAGRPSSSQVRDGNREGSPVPRGPRGLARKLRPARGGGGAALSSTRRLAAAAAIGGLVLGALVLGACGSSGSAQASTATSQACQQVSAILSDGPDPTADPVGYAEAQPLYLHKVHTSDPALRTAIDERDVAYQQMVATNGSATATAAQTKASNRLNAICPGAAP
jgi:hypothetical protein